MIQVKNLITATITSLMLITLTTQQSLRADDEPIGTLPGQPLSTGFSIQNDTTDRTLHANVSPDGQYWQAVPIAPQTTEEFTCGYYINFTTAGVGQVTYRINCDNGVRYSVGWNDSRGLWDVFMLR